jgi:magnesium transporter
MDMFDETIDTLETQVMAEPKPVLLTQIFSLKRSLQQIRRVSVHQRDMLLRISRGEFELVDKAALPFFRDVYDHFVRVADLTDSYRDLVAGILEMYLSVQGQRLNEVMKILTIISTIVLPLNFIAGVYGMNFDFLPGIHWAYGFAATVLVMLSLSGGLIVFFKQRGWL